MDILFSSLQGALNISSSPPDNRTIQNFVKDYVDEYVGGYNFVMPFLFVVFLHARWTQLFWLLHDHNHNHNRTELVNHNI